MGIERRNVLAMSLVGGAAVAVGGLVTGLSTPDTSIDAKSDVIDEIYEGRRITGSTTGAGNQAHGADGHHGVEARIDGHPMHVMRLSDGRFTTQINHYEHFDSLRDALRAAVDTLGPDAYPISLTDRVVA